MFSLWVLDRQNDDSIEVTVRREAVPDSIRASYVVGCDGAHSSVRGSLGVALEGKTHPERFLLADVTLDTPLDRSGTHVFVSTSGVLGIMPMPGGGFRLNGTLAAEEELDEAALNRMIRKRVGLAVRYRPSVQAWFLSRNEGEISDDAIGDPEERVAEALGLAEPAAVLVRPDGFVDWMGRVDVQSIASAFELRWNQSLAGSARHPAR
jgi:2-polyprenyl-6-methoxyphenol hydroxylase-like FAD-dependent oxidoreductase